MKDTDCKGERICEQGVCVTPKPATPVPAPSPTPTPAPTPSPSPGPSTSAPPAPEAWSPRGPWASSPRAAPPPPSAWRTVGVTGFEVSIRGGFMLPNGASPVQAPNFYNGVNVPGDAVGDILRGTEHPYGLEPFGLVVTAGYRFFPWLSAGLTFTYASFDSLDGTDTGDYADTTSQLERQMWTLGAYGRYYFTQFHTHLQPWVELALAYSDDNASYVRIATATNSTGGLGGQAEAQQYYLEGKGLDARLSIGLDWRLAPVFSFGPWASYERVIPLQGCVEIDVDTAAAPIEQQYSGQNRCGNPPSQANGYGVLGAGLALKLTFDPWAR
jgi:hypothetical protein